MPLQPVILHLLETGHFADDRHGGLLAIIRGLRGDKHMGNFYVDLSRGTAYVFMPLCLVVGVLLMASGVPMTLDGQRGGDHP